MSPTAKRPPTGPTEYRYIGEHAIILDGGQPLGPGDFVSLDEITPHNQELIDRGVLIDTSSASATSASSQEETE